MRKDILIVDDDSQIRFLLERVLNKAGFKPLCAASAEEALEIANLNNIQVFLLDFVMPGMNGIELCGEIRKINPTSIVFSMTGYASVFDLVKCREAGFDDYFVKPLDLKAVVKSVKDAFEKLERWRSR